MEEPVYAAPAPQITKNVQELAENKKSQTVGLRELDSNFIEIAPRKAA